MRSLATLALLGVLALAAPAARAGDQGIDTELVAIETLRRSGKVEDAARQAGELVESHPAELEAHVAHQDLQLALGNRKRLITEYRQRARAADAAAGDRYLHARLLTGRAAVAEFRAALKLDGNHFWSLCGVAAELTAMGKHAPADEALRAAMRVDEKSPIPVNLFGRLAEARGRNKQAETAYRRAIDLDADFVLARVNLGVLLVGMNRHDDALKVLEDASKRVPQDPMPLLGIGMAELGAGKPKEAVAAFEQAIALDSNSVTSLNLLANAYFNLQRLDLAERALTSALEKDAERPETRINLAHLHLLRGDNGLARLEAEAALDLDPDAAEAYFMLGLYFEREGKARKAESAYKKGAKLDKLNPVFHNALALLYAGQTRWRDAVKQRERVVELTDASKDSLLQLGIAQFSAKKYKNAVRSFEDVLLADENDLTALLNLGILRHHHIKDRKKAAAAYRRYIDHGGQDGRVRDWLAEVEK